MKYSQKLNRLYLFLVGNETPDDSYWTLRIWQARALGFIYVVAFLILFFQSRALWGASGLLPISLFIEGVQKDLGGTWQAFWNLPSLFYFCSRDAIFVVLSLTGIALATILIIGYANFPICFALWLMQLSFVNSGQLFYGYGWETQLLELTFLSIFLFPLWNSNLKTSPSPPPRIAIWALRWMLFRLMLGAGLIKIRGDQCWRDLTCLSYHYETQPNPNPLSYFLHQMPAWFHSGGVLFNHFIELIVPFGFFGPKYIRRSAGLITIIFQCILILSGNLAWLNWLTLVMCLCCFDDEFLNKMLKLPSKITQRIAPAFSIRYLVVCLGFGLIVVYLSIQPALNLISPYQAMNTSYDAWHFINSYGAFGSVGKARTEIIIEGTDDSVINDQTVWKQYEFKCAPGNISRRPCWISPYHFHLDWQIWFSAMRPSLSEEWLFRLIVRLLENDSEITSLFAINPFSEKPPHYIRMQLYQYQFADWKDWPHTWWKRDFIQEYMRPISLDTPLTRNYRGPIQKPQ